MTLLAFLLALGVLITAHEWGHYRMAVACGVKVLTFSIGFGRPLLRWKPRQPRPGQDTEFCVSLIPLGGYVKMLDEREGDVHAQEQAMAFNRQPLRIRAAIVAAGPMANLLLAVLLYAATCWLGQYETQATLAAPVAASMADHAGLRSGDTVLRTGTGPEDMQEVVSLEALRWWLIQHETDAIDLEIKPQGKQTSHWVHLPALNKEAMTGHSDAWQARGLTAAWSRPVLGEIQTGSPADMAGLLPRDEVLRIDGRDVSDSVTLRADIRLSGLHQTPAMQTWEVMRAGQRLTVNVQPERVFEGAYKGRIGAQVGEPVAKVWVQYGVWSGLYKAVAQTWQLMAMTLDMLGRLLTGHASWDLVGGPLVMADFAGRSAALGLGAYLSYLALVSVSLGVFNLLPLPVLDGGHLLYYLYEACTGHPPSPEWLDTMQRVGVATLVTLMVFSLFNDVVRLGWLPSVSP